MALHMIDDWKKDLRKVARKVESDWPGVVEADDIVQEVCLHILERPGTQRDLSEMDPNSRYRTIHKIAQRIASQERDAYDVFSGKFRYSVDEVRKLLEEPADPPTDGIGSGWSVGDQIRSGGEHSDQTGDQAVENIRVCERQKLLAESLAELKRDNERQFEALRSRFFDGTVPDRLDYATNKLIERALVSLTNRMNHAHKRKHAGEMVPGKSLGDGPGSRRAISNSAARFISKNSWDADYAPSPAFKRDNYIEPEVWDE